MNPQTAPTIQRPSLALLSAEPLRAAIEFVQQRWTKSGLVVSPAQRCPSRDGARYEPKAAHAAAGAHRVYLQPH
jgi:hypothetical protein